MGCLRGVYGFLVLFLCFDEESLEEGVRWKRKKGFCEILVVVGGGGINGIYELELSKMRFWLGCVCGFGGLEGWVEFVAGLSIMG